MCMHSIADQEGGPATRYPAAACAAAAVAHAFTTGCGRLPSPDGSGRKSVAGKNGRPGSSAIRTCPSSSCPGIRDSERYGRLPRTGHGYFRATFVATMIRPRNRFTTPSVASWPRLAPARAAPTHAQRTCCATDTPMASQAVPQ